MSRRGLVVALLCGLLGLAGGVVVAYVVQPRPSYGGSATPVPAESPSVPIDPVTQSSHAPDIGYASLQPGLPLPVKHLMSNSLARWRYHVPQGWTAYAVCQPVACPPPTVTDSVFPPAKIDRQTQVRFRPADEPLAGGYSLRVKILDNTDLNAQQMVATKIVGFRQEFTGHQFSITHKNASAVYFTFTDGDDHLRYNYFQWFQAPGQLGATLEMSVVGRQQDTPGLRALFNRFADNVTPLPPTA
jgi:hypothetical protein